MRVKEGGHVFMQGDLCSQVFMVRNGLLKAYYIRADGKEHIKSFQPEGSIIGSMVALMDAEAATFSLVAVEDSDLVALPYSQLADAARSDIQLAGALIEFLSAYGKRKERREFELLCLSPEDRFGLLQETMPSLLDRVSQADLAAYIGITPQALSRIKRRIKR
ncbi:MAG: Crp/Fnr family transcriptional regulator [Pseudomonadota bacterium]